MKPDAPRLARTQHLKTEVTRLIGRYWHATFGVQNTVRSKQRAHAFDCREKQIAVERRVEEHDVEHGRRQSRNDSKRVASQDLDLAGIQALLQSHEAGDEPGVALDHQDAARAARGEFEAECAGAGEKIQSAQRGGFWTQKSKPVEQRFAHAVRRGPQAGNVGDENGRAFPCPAGCLMRVDRLRVGAAAAEVAALAARCFPAGASVPRFFSLGIDR